jgi:hypothetical protein
MPTSGHKKSDVYKVVCSGNDELGTDGVPNGILRIFYTILYKNKFQNPQIFRKTHGVFPEQSTLVIAVSLHFNC